MRLTFLGTSAGENYPALWCNCPNCVYARRHGGKNIRQNTCTMLDDDVMLDLSNHAYMAKMIEDAMRGRIIRDDSRKWVHGIEHYWHDKPYIRVVVTEVEVA